MKREAKEKIGTVGLNSIGTILIVASLFPAKTLGLPSDLYYSFKWVAMTYGSTFFFITALHRRISKMQTSIEQLKEEIKELQK